MFTLTIRISLVGIKFQSAVIPVIRNTIIIIIEIAGITLAVLIVVGLVGIGNVGTVVQIVLVTILIDILIVVTFVTHKVRVGISLELGNRSILVHIGELWS